MKPADATFIISGGCSGLGLETARELHRAGANVLLLDLHPGLDEDVVKRFGADRAKFVQTDVTDTSSIQAAVTSGADWIKQTGKRFGGVVAAAGVGLPSKVRLRDDPRSLTGESPSDSLRRIIRYSDLRCTITIPSGTLKYRLRPERESPRNT